MDFIRKMNWKERLWLVKWKKIQKFSWNMKSFFMILTQLETEDRSQNMSKKCRYRWPAPWCCSRSSSLSSPSWWRTSSRRSWPPPPSLPPIHSHIRGWSFPPPSLHISWRSCPPPSLHKSWWNYFPLYPSLSAPSSLPPWPAHVRKVWLCLEIFEEKLSIYNGEEDKLNSFKNEKVLEEGSKEGYAENEDSKTQVHTEDLTSEAFFQNCLHYSC